ncbi:pyroglutamyl-peptidase I [Bdellovibrio sp. SKB1291214]|uniref:pyroglutamyl-peptidase I n=1 Tax=Bdellovibrio sp. SKB1291214 TaxID=1732569 RepID=UPI000B516C33|nr:pyroglutamyl-peptidase I [Bdellovibrio sp. SKB1291214]UYL07802.1 pyroglutamyl-peptidase I [Bdellovibrio sp. SKB1291214]
MKRILLTGFEPFGDQVINPSERLANKLSRTVNGIDQLILPVNFDSAFQTLQKHFESSGSFDVIVMLGQAAGRRHICLERFAHNWMENRKADKTNPVVPAQRILENQPDAVMTSLPVESLRDSLNTWLENDPVSVSLSAGNYVCNNLYFKVLTNIKNTPAVFIHVPLLPEQLKDGETFPTMEFDTQLLVLTAILETLKK